jgi:hypothetical protein
MLIVVYSTSTIHPECRTPQPVKPAAAGQRAESRVSPLSAGCKVGVPIFLLSSMIGWNHHQGGEIILRDMAGPFGYRNQDSCFLMAIQQPVAASRRAGAC